MRLLVVTHYFWPENFRINDLVVEMVRRGHSVVVLTGAPNYPDGKVFKEFRENPECFDQYEGAEIIRVPMLPRGIGSFRLFMNYLTFAISATLFGVWRLHGRQFDAILAYEPSPITIGIPAGVIRMIKKAPLAFWVLDLWPETLQAIGVIRSKMLLQLVGKLVESIYKRCDLILAQSKSFVPAITRYAGKDAAIVYFPNWSDSESSTEGVVAAPEITFIPGVFNILFAGNIGEAQDFPAILAAAEKLKNYRGIRWLIVGDGRMARWVADQIKLRGLESCVLMLGRFPVERMPEFFMHADALLVSLKDEPIFALTIPGKLQSYLAAEIPVLAMLNGEGSEVVTNGGAGLACRAGDYEALANAALRLAEMPTEERAEMGRRGLVLYREEFGREKLISQLEKWLENLRFRGDSALKTL